MIDILDEAGAGVDAVALEALARRVLREVHVSEESDLTILFVDEAEMAELHVTWLKEPGPTDVMSFPMDELRPGTEAMPTPTGVLGDIVVCPAVAERQAESAGQSPEREMGLLVVHGILHLLGYDHATPDEEKEMFGLQEQLLGGYPDR